VKVAGVIVKMSGVRSGDGVAVRVRDCMRGTSAVHLVPTRVMPAVMTSAVMTSAVTAREAKERHRGHSSGAEYHAEDVEVHRSKRVNDAEHPRADQFRHGDVVMPAASTQSGGELGQQN